MTCKFCHLSDQEEECGALYSMFGHELHCTREKGHGGKKHVACGTFAHKIVSWPNEEEE